MMMVILDPATAEAVRGTTANGAALDPRPLADGNFALPVRVLDDPNHAQHASMLAMMLVRDVGDYEWAIDDEA